MKLHPIKYAHQRFPRPGTAPYSMFIALFIYILGQLIFLIKSVPKIIHFKPHVVHLQSPHAFLIGIFCKLFVRSKIIVTFHGGDIDRIKNNKLFHLFIDHFDAFCYVSKNMIDKMESKFPNTIHIQTNSGVDLNQFKKTIYKKNGLKQFLAVGSLRWEKDYDTMLQSIKIVVKKYNDYHLVIVGEGYLDEAVRQIIYENGLQDKVTIKPFMSRFEIIEEMNRSVMFLMSSISEGMPKVLLEARACGLPIVSTDVGACNSITGKAGIVVKPNSPELFSDAIIELLENKEKYNKAVDSCLDGIEDYSWESNTNKLETIFTSLL